MVTQFVSWFNAAEPEFILLLGLPIIVAAIGLWAHWRETESAPYRARPQRKPLTA